jgi:hypothetical protein
VTLETITRIAIHPGNGAATEFPFTFRVYDEEDLIISLQDAITGEITSVLTPSQYSVVLNGDFIGGEVTYPLSGSPLTSAVNIIIARTVALTQPMDLENYGGFHPETVERQLDYIVMQIQQIAEETSRAVLIAPGGTQLIVAKNLADGEVLVKDGNMLARGPTTTEIANAQGYAESAAEDAERAEDALADMALLIVGIVAQKATVALAEADDPAVDPDYYDVAFYDTDYAAGSGGKYRKRASEPAGDAKFQNANGTWYELHEGEITPQAIDEIDVSVAAAAAAGRPVFLDDTQRTTTDLDIPNKVYGPGTDNVLFDYMPHPVGAAWEDRSRFSSGAQARAAEKFQSADVPGRRFTTVSASVEVGSLTWATASFTLVRDALGAFKSALPTGLFPGRKGTYAIRGSVSWEAEATGIRIAALTLNGSADINIVDQKNDNASAALETKQVLDFEEDIIATDYFGLRLWHSGSGTLTATVRLTIEALYQEPVCAPGSRLGLSAGPWEDYLDVDLVTLLPGIVTTHGGEEGLAQHIAANYDVFVFCNILASNYPGVPGLQTPNKTFYNCLGAWGNSIAYDVGYRIHDVVGDRMVICAVAHTSPGSGTFADYWAANPTHWRLPGASDAWAQVASVAWEGFPRVVRRIKALNPKFEAWAYISASIDALYTNVIGQPWSAYDGSRGIFNVQHYADRYDRMYPEFDGYFFDFFNPACINTVVRDQVLALTRAKGKKAACNLLSISAESLRFMAESPNCGRGDAALNEGFEYDSGVDVSVATDAFLAELAKHRARGIRNFAFAEEATAAAVIPGSVIDLAGRAKFASAFVPGDAYGYSWNGYTVI